MTDDVPNVTAAMMMVRQWLHGACTCCSLQQIVYLQLGVQGILVLDARKGGPAWKSGIKGTSRDKYGRLVLGDIITAMNNKRVRTASDLYKLLDKCSIGDVIDMEVCSAASQHFAVLVYCDLHITKDS